jgi:hypothetical protein
MIRFLLLIFLPMAVPFGAWWLWRVFARPPQIDPATGDQVPPDFDKAPLRGLFLVGALLTALTVGVFLIAHQESSEHPYQPIGTLEAPRPGGTSSGGAQSPGSGAR